MSSARLLARTPGAHYRGQYALPAHQLRFHKRGADGSAKCDAFFTGQASDQVLGVLYNISPGERRILDEIEGLGRGYDARDIMLKAPDGAELEAYTYVATDIETGLSTFGWYQQHVLVGAHEVGLPQDYINDFILAIDVVADKDTARDREQRSIHARRGPG